MTDATSTIPTDVHDVDGNSPDDSAAAAFLSSFTDDPKPGPSKGGEEATEHREATPEGSEQTTEGETEGEPTEHDPDDDEIEIKVGEETHKAKLRELKRLYGQEAALTQKSQRAAEAARAAEAETARAKTTAEAMLARAKERYAPYEGLDWLVLSQRMATEEFEQLRNDAAMFESDVKFLTTEVESHMQALQAKQQASTQAAAQETLRTLQDPQKGIPGFNREVYQEMVAFGTEHGLPEVAQLVSAPALKLIHMAMQYAKAQKAAKAAEAKARTAVDQPTRTLAPAKSKQSEGDSKRAALKAMRDNGGDIDSTTAAFLATF